MAFFLLAVFFRLRGCVVGTLLHLFTGHHLYTLIYYIHLVKRVVPDVVVHVHRFGIVAHLCLSLLHVSRYFSLRRIIGEWHDCRMTISCCRQAFLLFALFVAGVDGAVDI